MAPLRSAHASAGPRPRSGSSSTSTQAAPSSTSAAPGANGAGSASMRPTEVVADECLQLQAAQLRAAVVADGDYFLPALPLRAP